MEPTLIETKHQGQAMASDSSSTIAHGRATEEAVLEFGRFRLLLRQRQLMADGAPIELGARAFELLLALIEAEGLVLTKDALMVRVWPGIVVAPDNLKVQIAALRKALGEKLRPVRAQETQERREGNETTLAVLDHFGDDVAVVYAGPAVTDLNPGCPRFFFE